MALLAGVDIGNNTTEVAVAEVSPRGDVRFLSGGLVRTVGIKGTLQNAIGAIDALDVALAPLGKKRRELDLVLLNEATPVIGDVAMETITETVITESAMIGHNPTTPGGEGLGFGETILLSDLAGAPANRDFIVVVPAGADFRETARQLNAAMSRGVRVTGAIVRGDDAVLIENRLARRIPIVDEVLHIERVPLGMPAAVEVAPPGRSVQKLSNPYDIATLFALDPEETRRIVPIARALMGNRSAVVIKTPKGDIQERRIPAGRVFVTGERRTAEIGVDEGAEAIMGLLSELAPLREIRGEPGTNVGGMFENVRRIMAELTDQAPHAIQVRDILAVDTFRPQQVAGALAGEYVLGNAVGLAAMVETHRLPMQRLAHKLQDEIEVPVSVGGVEGDMAVLGALTTPGTRVPLAILDLGGGSTDAAVVTEAGETRSMHLAGAGDMVTMLIDSELGLDDRTLAEEIKRHPLAKVESLFHMRHEDGSVQFTPEPVEPRLFGRVAVLSEGGPIPLHGKDSLERVAAVRRDAKKKVFVRNALRALTAVAPAGNIRLLHFVVLVGGSALDFEIPKMITDALMEYGVVTGRANVRGTEGPRSAVATGLVLAHAERLRGG